MSAGFTPGPWDITGCQFPDDDGEGVYYRVTAEGMDASGANARLIAAAPELYETLEAIADESVFNQQRFAEDSDTDYFLRCFKAVKERACAALAKARGDQ